MIKFELTEVAGFGPAIRGMRNPMNSWDRSDTNYCWDRASCKECPMYVEGDICKLSGDGAPIIGPNDHELMMKLAKGGPVHAKYRRMMKVYVDITAPLYWWKEFDTYKVGTVANSCSTMHKIHAKEFTLEDFSCEKLFAEYGDPSMNLNYSGKYPKAILQDVIHALNNFRYWYNETKDKRYWEQMIQLLPSSYNQRRTVEMNYEVLTGIYPMRKNHKLDEWRQFCKWIEGLPYSELITGEKEDDD
jgi:hypothetical protein